MAKDYKKTLFIHRRDLRVQDNTALNAALKESEAVLPCFILDPRQVSDKNAFKSERQVTFMKECLADLSVQYEKLDGRLFIFLGDPARVVETLIKKEGIGAVYVNMDYTPYAKRRDEAIESVCKKHGVTFKSFHDLLLSGDPEAIKNKSGKPYTVFTQYWKNARVIPVENPVRAASGTFAKTVTDKSLLAKTSDLKAVREKAVAIVGGRTEARKILAKLSDFELYAERHNDVFDETTRLSAHNKFGTVSIREVYHAMIKNLRRREALLRQLYWRDFYTMIAFYFPEVIGSSFNKKNEFIFGKSMKGFEEWKLGKTGFPLVDAGMRELNATGYMHNRARLVVGSFLTKDLHIYWWEGEKYFAQMLVDYDISVNNGNWQWVAGTGTDPMPYFRIFNPWLQSKKFDPQALYIKRWVPELKDVEPEHIHNLFKNPLPKDHAYPTMIVDHAAESSKIREKTRNKSA